MVTGNFISYSFFGHILDYVEIKSKLNLRLIGSRKRVWHCNLIEGDLGHNAMRMAFLPCHHFKGEEELWSLKEVGANRVYVCRTFVATS